MKNEKTDYSMLDNDTINLRAELEKYITHWKWFILGVLLSLLGAFLFLTYSTPQYLAKATILIKDDEKGGLSDGLAAFGDLGILNGGGGNIDNEIQIIKSRRLIGEVIKKLNLTTSYFLHESIIQKEIYKTAPIKISFENLEYKIDSVISIKINSENSFTLFDQDDNEINTEVPFGNLIKNSTINSLRVNKTNYFNEEKVGNTYTIAITPLNTLIDSYLETVSVRPISKKSSVLQFSLKTPVIQKGENILDEIIQEYNKEAVDDKKEVSHKTSLFIAERLKHVTTELALIDDKVKGFKSKNNIADIEAEAKLILETNAHNQKKLIQATTELNLVKALSDEIKVDENLLPANLGLEDPNISKAIENYNSLILKRRRLSQSAGQKNSILIQIEDNISNLKKSLKRSLANRERLLEISLQNIKTESGRNNSKISQIPSKERDFLDIARQQEIIAGLYSYLLKKKEETAISLTANAIPNAKIIDKAYASDKPVSPKNKIILLVALLLGLIIPFIIIYLKDLLDTKVHTRKDIEELTSIPFVGDIPHSEVKQKIVIDANARSSTAEAFRLIRTNLDFMLPKKKDNNGRIVFVTSTTSGEGKSFSSINLAASLTLSGKKVVLVGLDLRAPKITEYLEIPDRKGVTNFLTNDTITLDSLKFSIPEIPNLDIIASGAIPPNPAELLMASKMDLLFEELEKNYDYVMIDTAPVNLVTDTLLIANRADLVLYVTRANYLDKRMLIIPEGLYRDKKLPNLAIILNDTDLNRGYGYGYGLASELDHKPWYKKIFS
ncbi:GumC family protein [Tenacibaculum sp. C7A-26P2]|uniref:GumC family protein n=1 Tax=Tenacibaculum sp. C7A-26P2 TaxID=3447504 RepID=UPI003F82F9EF